MAKRNRPFVVIVDDDERSAEALAYRADAIGFESVSCFDAESALLAIDRCYESGRLAGVLSDLKLPGTAGQAWGGWEVLTTAYSKSRSIRLAAFTSYFGHEFNEVFRSGAAIPAFTIFNKERAKEAHSWLESTWEEWSRRLALALQDAHTREIYEQVAPIYARSDLPILILGETGTGKESLARHIHDLSASQGEFVPVNCGGLEPTLALAEFFGHTRSAFTDAGQHALGLVLRASGYVAGSAQAKPGVSFEAWLRGGNRDLVEEDGLLRSRKAEVDAGTLFLDEIAALPVNVMAGLLRLLSTGDIRPSGHRGLGIKANCRIVAATNQSKEIRESFGDHASPSNSRFRRDLYYRLAGAILVLRPVRERDPSDIRDFLTHSVWRQLPIPRMEFDEASVDRIISIFRSGSDDTARQYQKGNFRALRNLVHRACLLAIADGSSSVRSDHVEVAVKHGELVVEKSEPAGSMQHIRDSFRMRLGRRGVKLGLDFSRQELIEVTKVHPKEVGESFIYCACIARQPTDGKERFYGLAEIEKALGRGFSSNSWLNKHLKKDSVRSAAIDFFGVPEEECRKGATAKRVVDLVRKRDIFGKSEWAE